MLLIVGKIGARGFEPPTSCSRSRRASRAALRPVLISIIIPYFDADCQINVNFPDGWQKLFFNNAEIQKTSPLRIGFGHFEMDPVDTSFICLKYGEMDTAVGELRALFR